MAQIQILSDDLINKIAAGEVIERPASAVKELLENSLDAGAKRITVEVEAGGKRLIRVTDDGCGMSHDDALLAVERHATSKLRTVEDLIAISTLGFRGEALPSIASVSRFTLETRPAEANAGVRIEIHGGKMRNVKEAGCPPGTQIEVQRLFSNVPARRKFLRTDTTELGHVASLVTHYALAHPEISFVLKSGNHTILDAPPVGTLQERVFQVLGRSAVDELVDLGEINTQFPAYRPDTWFQQEPAKPESPGEISARGFVSRPEFQKVSAKTIYIFINRRFVRDRILLKAIREAYRHVLPARAYPTVLLFLDLPHKEVDVNVHPQKTEVRFRHQGFVYDFVHQAIRQAIAGGRPVATGEAQGVKPTFPASSPAPSYSPGPQRSPTERGVPGGSRAEGAMPFSLESSPVEYPPAGQRLPFTQLQSLTQEAPTEAVTPDALPLRENIANLRPLGQLNNSFIVAVNEAGLWLVDQHVAHERVLFEGHARARKAKSVEGQRLLMPVVVELTPAQVAVWGQIRDELDSNGFEMDEMGERTVAVKAAPAGIKTGDVEKLLHEIFDNVEKESRQLSLEALQEKVAASVACHAAIKINMPLTDSKMQWLLGELAQTENPSTCPHGRPIVLRYPLRDILKSFKRI